MISYVTTRKSGWSSQNGGSVNGETLVWIYGLRMLNQKKLFFTIIFKNETFNQ